MNDSNSFYCILKLINKHLDFFSFKVIIIAIISIAFQSCFASSKTQIYFRFNQLGFKPNEMKTGVLFSEQEITSKSVKLMQKGSGVISEINIYPFNSSWGRFKHFYNFDFTSFNKNGEYYFEIDGHRSQGFSISEKVYNGLLDSLLKFFKVQRCGPTNPILHEVCHIYDSPYIIGDSTFQGTVDVTGGWHDAGDYIKFLSTTAYSTYLMLLAYELSPNVFEFDNDKSGAPDILEEAKVGIDWMLRANYEGAKLITQVQDLRDHDFGWRLPENDQLKYDRPAFYGMGKNQVGIYSAVMALASKIWKSRFNEIEFGNKCLNAAMSVYNQKDSVPDVDSSYTGVYKELNWKGKLSLGAIELFNTTGDKKYYNDAVYYANRAGSDYWWSWGDINAIAHFRLAKYDKTFSQFLLNNLNGFLSNSRSSIFGEPTAFTWGTTNTFLGVTLTALLYKDLEDSDAYDTLIFSPKDYILGKNPWGISFIYKVGNNYVKNLHSQVAYFNNGYLPGAISAGPAPISILNNYKIERTNLSTERFNTTDVKFYDDRNDYITNEPTIVTNATALIVFGLLMR